MASQFSDIRKVTYLAVNQRTGQRFKVAAVSQELALHQLLRSVPLGSAYDWAIYATCGCGKPLNRQRHCSQACADAGNDGTATNLIRRKAKVA